MASTSKPKNCLKTLRQSSDRNEGAAGKLHSQVSQWMSKAEKSYAWRSRSRASPAKLNKCRNQLETMGQWQQEFESRFQQMLDFQKQMMDSRDGNGEVGNKGKILSRPEVLPSEARCQNRQ